MPSIELFDKQADFFESSHRNNFYVGGIQSGKTTCGAVRMFYDNMRHRHAEDNFIIAADTYKTLSQATIPKFLSIVGKYGKMNWGKAEFKFRWGSTVFCRTATDPESMEGITNVRRVWIDELGKCSRYFFENAMGRAAFKEAPLDGTTTPYALNWLSDIHRDWERGKLTDTNFVICRSIDSPYFPKAEYERQRAKLDPRRFAMKYEGTFGKIEGLVYDHLNLCRSFALPPGTVYYAGVDWGYHPDPFCLIIRAVTPDKKHYRVEEYFRNYMTISEIVRLVQSYNSIYNFRMIVCDPSQPAHIEEFNRQGLVATGAENDIQYGIECHYELIKTERFWIFDDRNPIGLDEYNTYHYPEERELGIDQSRNKRERKPVDKNNHGVDADRYLSVYLERNGIRRTPIVPNEHTERPRDLQKRIEWLKRGGRSRQAGGE